MPEEDDYPPGQWPEFTDGVIAAYYNLPHFSHQCGVEQLIYPEVPPGVRSKQDWHAMCRDSDCECLAHL